ncbi:S9 family peptidase [Trueperella sp. LYQ143]|uniref:S9 family peptidase n=1 Tax=unclassified Trueperella TaxID=2630174 RepID=UPI00398309B1
MSECDDKMANRNAGAPKAERIAQERVFHGRRFVDYYEWMRDDSNPAVRCHIDAENEWFDRCTADQVPLREELVREYAAHTQETDVSVPVRQGDYWYWRRTWEGRPYSGLFRVPVTGAGQRTDKYQVQRPATDTYGETCVYDGNQLGAHEEFFATGGGAVSPDGERYALAIDTSGSELYRLRIHDIDRDLVIDDALDNIGWCVGWTADSAAVFYTRCDDAWRPYQLWLHRVGQKPETDELLYEEKNPSFGLYFSISRNHQWLVLNVESTDSSEVHLFSTADPHQHIRVCERQAGVLYDLSVGADKLFIVHNANHTGFELSSAPIAQSTVAEWTSLVSAQEGERILGVSAFQDFLVLAVRSNVSVELRVIEPGRDPYRIPTAETMSVELADNPQWDTREIDVVCESIVTPRTWMSWNLDTHELQTLKTQPVPGYNAEDYVEYRQWATAPDGTAIPLTIAHHKDVQPDGKNPGFLTGYGSYEVSFDPMFSVCNIAYLERKMVFAIAHIRGGGDLGRQWYEDGRLLNKKNTFTDFVACGEHLINCGLVDKDRLAARGGSAGGLLMGAVVNIAPHLFRVINADVPFVDALTTILKPELPLTIGEWEEWGNPIESADVYDYMASYSPYENISAQRYPAILATTSLNDIRVSYLEPTKWVQELRHTVAPDSGLIVQHTTVVAGHAGGSGRYEGWKDRARIMAFILRELGVA